MADTLAFPELALGQPFFSKHADVQLYKSLGFACVYAIGPERGRPMNVGWAASPSGKFDALRAASWHELKIHDIAWTVGPPLAKRLLSELHGLLDKAGRRIRGDWFDVTVDLVVPAFQIATDKAGIETFTHEGMLDRVAAARKVRTASALRRVGS